MFEYKGLYNKELNMKGTRRDFFGQSAKLIATGIIGSSIIDKVAQATEPVKRTDTPTSKPSPVELRTLGKTGLKISVISCGSIGTSENVVRYAMDHGINFIHTSYDYNGGKSIREVGKALKGKNRNKAILGLKVVWNWSQDEILNRSLKLMGRDYVDIIFFNIHTIRLGLLRRKPRPLLIAGKSRARSGLWG